MSNGLAVQMNSDVPNFTAARPKLLQAVPVYRPRSFTSVPVVAPRTAGASLDGGGGGAVLEALWLCQECDKQAAVVAGCFCLSCVQDYRACLHCGIQELPHHRANRIRHRTALIRTTYVCLACAHQNMCWNQSAPMAVFGSPQPHQQQQPLMAMPSAGSS
jgi:hypothetical protein